MGFLAQPSFTQERQDAGKYTPLQLSYSVYKIYYLLGKCTNDICNKEGESSTGNISVLIEA